MLQIRQGVEHELPLAIWRQIPSGAAIVKSSVHEDIYWHHWTVEYFDVEVRIVRSVLNDGILELFADCVERKVHATTGRFAQRTKYGRSVSKVG